MNAVTILPISAPPPNPPPNPRPCTPPPNPPAVQMNAGIVLSYFNQRYFADTLSTLCEFIPQMIFLNALFGYLCLLIVMKWATGSTADLYHTLIYMFLSVSVCVCVCVRVVN